MQSGVNPNGTKGVFREVYSIHRQGSTLTKPKQVFKLLYFTLNFSRILVEFQ